MSRSKVYPDAASAVDGLLFNGMTIMSGGLSGNPEHLIPAIKTAAEVRAKTDAGYTEALRSGS